MCPHYHSNWTATLSRCEISETSLIYQDVFHYHGPGRSVGIATDYGLDGPGIESRWEARFSARPDRAWGLIYNGYWVFPGGKVRPGRAADHSPPTSAVVMEE